MPFTRTAAIYTVPDLTLGTTNVQGSSDGIRADASIAIFDGTVVTTAAASDTANTGSASVASRRDHLHGMPASFTTFAAPSFTLGTSNVTGTGDTVHAGATLLAFDATDPTGVAEAAATGSAVVASRRDHVHSAGVAMVVDYQAFTSDDTWTKPAGSVVIIEVIAGGGSGGGGSNVGADYPTGGGGGGGGSISRGIYTAASLPSSLTVTVGDGGAETPADTVGNAGALSQVSGTDFLLSAYGGGGGEDGTPPANDGAGGGGGGIGGVGVVGASGTGGIGGIPSPQPDVLSLVSIYPPSDATVDGDGVGGRGAAGGDKAATTGGSGSNAQHGGGGGGATGTGAAADGGDGGSSLFAAGGGGSGGTKQGGDGGTGGAWGSLTTGGGGAKGTGGDPPTPGTAGDTNAYGAGDGGGGGGGTGPANTYAGSLLAGGPGGFPGGGGGGGGGQGNGGYTGGVGAAGGDGQIRIWIW